MTLEALPGALSVTPTALVLEHDLDFARWQEVGQVLGTLARATPWWVGDWLLHGEHKYGEKYVQAANLTGLRETTLMNYASVCRLVPPSRRVSALSFSSHAAVASLDPGEQRDVLARAAEQELTSQDVRDLVAEREPHGRVSVREAAMQVWSSAELFGRRADRYLVPASTMQTLARALGAMT